MVFRAMKGLSVIWKGWGKESNCKPLSPIKVATRKTELNALRVLNSKTDYTYMDDIIKMALPEEVL